MPRIETTTPVFWLKTNVLNNPEDEILDDIMTFDITLESGAGRPEAEAILLSHNHNYISIKLLNDGTWELHDTFEPPSTVAIPSALRYRARTPARGLYDSIFGVLDEMGDMVEDLPNRLPRLDSNPEGERE